MGQSATLRRLAIPAALACALLVPASAPAAGPGVLGLTCTAQPDGVRQCGGSGPGGTPTSVNVDANNTTGQIPIDVNVTLPPASGSDGGYPLVILPHGYGGQKIAFDGGNNGNSVASPHEWASRGYAVLTNSDRGFWGTCGTVTARVAGGPGCARGWNQLMQARYEVRDAQNLAGMLVDQGWVDPARIGSTGYSYGGGESLLLGTLKDRVMNTDGTLAPWTSPMNRIPMRIAGTAPLIPWSDLISSLVPNGHQLDYTLPPPNAAYTDGAGHFLFGVEKQSFVTGLFASGQFNTGVIPNPGKPPTPDPSAPPNAVIGYYSPPGADPDADLSTDYTLINGGEPYESNPRAGAIITSFRNYRGALYLLNGGTDRAGPPTEPPAPMLLSNGFTDDLFPVDETVRYYNLAKTLFPSTPLSLVYLDYGHMRGQNKPADTAFLKARVDDWMDHYVKGTGGDPGQSAVALTQTCPGSAASGGPFVASDWVGLNPGILPYISTNAQTLTSPGGDPSISKAIDPVAGNGACATAPGADQGNGVASYDLRTSEGAGYTMIGAPIVVAQLGAVTGSFAQIAARLWDVAPDGSETLVARGNYRVPSDVSQPQYFQLHAGAWRFAPGHHPKLELLGQDTPYLRTSNGGFSIRVDDVYLLLPTHETSGNGIIPRSSLPAPCGSVPAPGIHLTCVNPFAGLRRAGGRGCSAKQRFNIPLRYNARTRGRVRSVVVTAGRRRLRTLHGRNLRRVIVGHLPTGASFTLRVVARTTRGFTITSTRTYHNCHQTRRREVVRRVRRRR